MARGPAASLACAALLAACASPAPEGLEARIADARRERAGDPAVEARISAVEAALARERSEVPLDEVEVRVSGHDDGDSSLRVRTRLPVPNPLELGARRAVRRAETETSLAELDETVLARSAESCGEGIELAFAHEREQLYENQVGRERALLAWNAEWRRSGVWNEGRATRFEIERQLRLAERLPEPRPGEPEQRRALPPVAVPEASLDRSRERVREQVRRHPARAVRIARAEHFRALGERSGRRDLPWLEFVDVDYEVRDRQPDEVGGQVAVRVPLGFEARADASRYASLGAAELREGERIVDERVQLAEQALAELDWFESNASRWRDLLALAERAEGMAEQWQARRLVSPSDVATLFDRAYQARFSVLEARARAGLAGCRLLDATGVAPEAWPRLP